MSNLNITAIANAASTSKKPTKEVAHVHLRSVIAELEGQDQTPEVEAALASLYAFFLPKAPAKPKTHFQWVAKAIAKNDQRYYLNYVFVTEDHIVGTDGHRLHLAPNSEGLAPGFYDAAGTWLHEPDWARFPNFLRVIPACEKRPDEFKQVTVKTSELKIHDDVKLQYFDLPGGLDKTIAEWGPRVNRPYYLAAVSMEGDEVPVWIGEENSAIRMDLPGGRTAVVMPMRK